MGRKGQWFASEASLCRHFIEAACKDDQWVAYPETEGWDIVLVRKPDGVQIGIQAKLSLNAKVVTQALPHWVDSAVTGPDYRAVLVPRGDCGGMGPLCGFLGITVIVQNPSGLQERKGVRFSYGSPFDPSLPEPGSGSAWWQRSWHPWLPVERIKLPDYVPDVAAGAPAPKTLSHWKVQAIKLAILLEERPVTRADIKALGISPTRWTDRYTGWLVPTPQGYVPCKDMPDFAAMHPKNYAEIKADRPNWEKDMRTQGRLEF